MNYGKIVFATRRKKDRTGQYSIDKREKEIVCNYAQVFSLEKMRK